MKVKEAIKMIEKGGWFMIKDRMERAGKSYSAYSPDLPGCAAPRLVDC
jgi:predicted RNase H-like HicB family nuclease